MLSAPPPPYWGWDIRGGHGTLLAVTRGSERAPPLSRISPALTSSTLANAPPLDRPHAGPGLWTISLVSPLVGKSE
jgi:hypothetical protein